MANHELNELQRLEAAGLSRSTPNDPHMVRVYDRKVLIRSAGHMLTTRQVTATPEVRQTPAPPERHWSVEAEIASIYHTGDQDTNDPTMCMV